VNYMRVSVGAGRATVSGVLLLGLFGVTSEVAGQDQDWCDQSRRGQSRGAVACQVQEYTFDGDGDLRIDGGLNGGVTVEGWAQNHVLVLAKVQTYARTQDRADELLARIEVQASRRVVESDGPDARRRENWSVSYRVFVPQKTDLSVETHNGGVSLSDLDGRVRFKALNGGVSLAGLSGDVSGRTTNGGLNVVLSGDHWEGRGLDVQTTNGSVSVSIPDGYSAELNTGTVNGGIRTDFPITVRGKIGRSLRTTLGDGGATISVTTTNGGVVLRQANRR